MSFTAIERGDRSTNGLDDTHALVPEDPSWFAGRNVPFENVQIGSANRRLGDFDDGVRWHRNFRSRPFFEGLFPRPEVHKRLHAGDPCSFGCAASLSNDAGHPNDGAHYETTPTGIGSGRIAG